MAGTVTVLVPPTVMVGFYFTEVDYFVQLSKVAPS